MKTRFILPSKPGEEAEEREYEMTPNAMPRPFDQVEFSDGGSFTVDSVQWHVDDANVCIFLRK